MVEIIGLATMTALTWLLASSMATESDSEKRRASATGAMRAEIESSPKARHAA
jgi:hypothetical protein